MSEYKNKVSTKEIKQEATQAVNEVKSTIKNVDIKKDSLETKGFVTEMFKRPLEKLNEIATKKDKNFLKYVVIIIAIWCIVELVHECFSLNLWGYAKLRRKYFKNSNIRNYSDN